jgi:hypothetical protein
LRYYYIATMASSDEITSVNSALERYAEHFNIAESKAEMFDTIKYLSELEEQLTKHEIFICQLDTTCKCSQEICSCVDDDYTEIKQVKCDTSMNNKYYIEIEFSKKFQSKKNLRIFSILEDGEDKPFMDILKSEDMVYIYGKESATYTIDEIKINNKTMTIILDYMSFDVDK